MAVVTLKPDGDGTTSEWTPKGAGDNYVEVDEGIAGADDDATENTVEPGELSDFYTLGATPGDFDVCIDATGKVRAYQSGWVDDLVINLRVDLRESDETFIAILHTQSLSSVTSYTTLTGSAVANTDSKALWDTYRIEVVASKVATGMPDAITVFCTAVEVVLNYSTGGTAHTATVTLSGTGAMTALATHGNIAQVTMSGAGTLSSVATAGWLGKAAMSGTGAMTARGIKGLLGKAVMNSTGAMAALATYGASGKATMSGAGSMDALATQGLQGKATMSGTGSLTALGGLVHGGAVTLSGVGTLSLIPALTHGAKAVLSGAGSMTAVGSRFVAGAVTMSGAGTLTAKATVAFLAAVSMAGSGAMAAAGTLGHVAKVAFAGVGSMTVAGTRTVGGIAATAASRIRWFTT